MEKLTTKKKLAVVRQYLSGLYYDEIAAKSGSSKGMGANMVAEQKGGGFPDAADVGEQIEVLRELSLDLKRSGIAPGQCAVGLAVLNRINECGLDAADIGRWPAILKAAGSAAARPVRAAAHIVMNPVETVKGMPAGLGRGLDPGGDSSATMTSLFCREFRISSNLESVLSRRSVSLSISELSRSFCNPSDRISR